MGNNVPDKAPGGKNVPSTPTGKEGKEGKDGKTSKPSSYLSSPGGLSNMLFGGNDDKNNQKNNMMEEKEEKNVPEKTGPSRYLPESMSRAFSYGSSQNTTSSTSLSSGNSSFSSSSYFRFSTPKKEVKKFDENVHDACEILTLLEICLMHGIRIKEFHGVIPLWTLLER